MERAELEVTPVFIALPLNDDVGANAEAQATRADRMKAMVFMVVCRMMYEIEMRTKIKL